MATDTNDTTIIILGGYGNAGLPITRLLLQYTDAKFILAGRNIDRARNAASDLNQDFPGDRVTTCYVDASQPKSLLEAFQQDKVKLVLVASSTSAFTREVASAALQANIDYYDIIVSSEKLRILNEMKSDIEKSNLCFITDGGFHPGLPAALIRHVAPLFQEIQTARVGSVIHMDWSKVENPSRETVEEFAGEFIEMKMLSYKNGQWKDEGFQAMMKPPEMDFGEPFRKSYVIPMFLEEMRAIPDMYPTLSETGFFVGGFNWVVDWIISPIIILALSIRPTRAVKERMGRLLLWGLRKFSRPPYGTQLMVDARGLDAEGNPFVKTLSVSHEDGYLFTAIPVAATTLQYLDERNSIRKPGLWFQAHIVHPSRLLSDMDRMGVKTEPPLRQPVIDEAPSDS